MAGRKGVSAIDLSGALNNPAAVSAFLASVLRKTLAEEGAEEIFSAISSISERENAILVKMENRTAAAALSLRAGKIETAFAEALGRFGRKGKVTVRIR